MAIVKQAVTAVVTMLALGGPAFGAIGAQQPDPATTPVRIFFDWGKALVSQDSAAALDDVAARLLQPGSAAVTLVGHSDRSGPSGANRHAALLRAEAVRDYLVRRGVPAALIKVGSRGEDTPLIATADGVREPQNRRVDIEVAGRSER